MNGLRIFENPDFGSVRIITGDAGDNIMFCAMDVCSALGYSNGRDAVLRHVEKDDVGKHDTIDSMGRTQSLTYVTESGLYALVFGSRQERSKKFKHWVTSEVLPSIRKTGSYSVNEPSLDQKVQANITYADWAIKTLNLNQASRILWTKRIGESLGLVTDAIPQVVNSGTDHPTLHSAQDLLKTHRVGLSAQKFNKLLESKGIVKTASRPGKGGTIHTWKVLQPAYGKYGQNTQDPKFQNQTQIKWYDNLFGELLVVAAITKEETLDI